MTWKLLPDKKISILSFSEAFSPEEAQEIVDRCSQNEGMTHVGNNQFSYKCLPLDPVEWAHVYDRITAVVLDCNVNNYNFKLQGIPQLFYVEFSDSDFMEWSMDLVHSHRETNKLTVHTCLNEDFEGGEFMILNPEPTSIAPKTGVVSIFPSFIISKQHPTKNGIKRVIIGTVAGLPFS